MITLGILGLIDGWNKNSLKESSNYLRVDNLDKATHIILVNHFQEKFFIPLKMTKLLLKENFELDTYTFEADYQLFYWNFDVSRFESVEEF